MHAFQRNMLPPSSRLKYVDSGIDLVVQASDRESGHVTQRESVEMKRTWSW
jgi:hypothetical protein